MFQEQDGSNVIEAASKKDGVAYLKKIMKRKRYSNEYIDKLLKEAVIKEGEEVSSLEFKKEISIDYSRFALAVIKIAYEYAFTKLGETYLDDEVAVLFSNELFQNAYSMRKNNEISDELAKFVIFLNNNDSKWTILTEIKDNISKLNQPVLHNITMLRKDESLYCAVTLCVEPYLSSIIKITQNAGNYKIQMASSYILKNGAVLEIP